MKNSMIPVSLIMAIVTVLASPSVKAFNLHGSGIIIKLPGLVIASGHRPRYSTLGHHDYRYNRFERHRFRLHTRGHRPLITLPIYGLNHHQERHHASHYDRRHYRGRDHRTRNHSRNQNHHFNRHNRFQHRSSHRSGVIHIRD